MLVRSALPVYVQASLPEAAGEKLTVLSARVGQGGRLVGRECGPRNVHPPLAGRPVREGGRGRGRAGDRGGGEDVPRRHDDRRRPGWSSAATRPRAWSGRPEPCCRGRIPGGRFRRRPSLDFPGSISGVRAEDAEGSVATTGGAEDPPLVETAESVEASLGLTRAERFLVQHGLSSLGEGVGVADGVFGRRTRAGIRSYQEKKGLPETGYLTGELRDTLVVLGGGSPGGGCVSGA